MNETRKKVTTFLFSKVTKAKEKIILGKKRVLKFSQSNSHNRLKTCIRYNKYEDEKKIKKQLKISNLLSYFSTKNIYDLNNFLTWFFLKYLSNGRLFRSCKSD